MKKFIFMMVLAGVSLSLLSSSTYGWGSITHTFIAKELGKKFGYGNLQEMYGSTVADMVNLKNITPTEDYESLYAKLHFIEPGSQEAIVNEAKWCFQKAAVFGLSTHNDVWGADYYAHHDAASIPGPDSGYVSPKAAQLITDLDLEGELSSILIDAGVPPLEAPIFAQALALTIADFGVETGVDFLIKREDPLIGLRLFFAASYRSGWIPYMLARAYSGGDLALAQIIIGSEKEFKEIMKLYGQAFLLNEEAAINSIVTQWTPLVYEIAQEFYPGTVISEEIEQRLIDLGVEVVESGIDICETDYYDEIMEVIDAVGLKLQAEGIDTCP